jgi:hypothetical protein
MLVEILALARGESYSSLRAASRRSGCGRLGKSREIGVMLRA